MDIYVVSHLSKMCLFPTMMAYKSYAKRNKAYDITLPRSTTPGTNLVR